MRSPDSVCGIPVIELVWPSRPYLPGYIHALQQGRSPDNLRPETAQDHLAHIAEDADDFISRQVDREAKGSPMPSQIHRANPPRLRDARVAAAASVRTSRGRSIGLVLC